jgi:hypothetical protein
MEMDKEVVFPSSTYGKGKVPVFGQLHAPAALPPGKESRSERSGRENS